MVAIHRAREMIIAALFVLNCVLSTIRADPSAYGDHALAWRPASSLPDELRDLGVRALIRDDAEATARASADFGNMSVDVVVPAAVLYPSCPDDIAALLHASSARPSPFPVSARGCGHSIRGQASAAGGVVVDMPSLGRLAGGSATRLSVSVEGRYIDAGGEQLWVDVLHTSLAHGLTPRSWTDYLHLTVGGTLSNAGISGQAFRHGPQISNVQELDVITGTYLHERTTTHDEPGVDVLHACQYVTHVHVGLGERVTCSKEKDRDLFDAVLGGLGQFGVITRARIPLVPAPARARWVRLLYTDAAALTKDQERLIDIDVEIGTGAVSGLMDYVEGSVLADQGLAGSWRSSFFSEADAARVAALAKEAGGVLYCLEGALYYGGAAGSERDVDKVTTTIVGAAASYRGQPSEIWMATFCAYDADAWRQVANCAASATYILGLALSALENAPLLVAI
jgi:cytokinin dehydrogenase